METVSPFEGEACRWALIAEGLSAAAKARKAFEKGLTIERCGRIDQVTKFLPALTIDHDALNQGLEIFEEPWPKR